MNRCLIGVLLLSAVTFGQAPPAFEVASIRPSSEQVTQVSAGLRVAGSQVRVTGMSLKDYIGMAYGVKPQQIEGPDWLGQARFDLAATIPADGSAAQLEGMLQSLLADRFKMTMHREKKEFPVYALGVARGGAKLQPSAAGPEPVTTEKQPEVNVAAGGSSAGVGADLGGGSSFMLGNNRLEVKKLTMTDFAEVLTRFVDRAVINETGLTGKYDVTLELAPEDYMPVSDSVGRQCRCGASSTGAPDARWRERRSLLESPADRRPHAGIAQGTARRHRRGRDREDADRELTFAADGLRFFAAAFLRGGFRFADRRRRPACRPRLRLHGRCLQRARTLPAASR